MIGTDVFRDQPTFVGERVRLEPLGPAVLDDYLLYSVVSRTGSPVRDSSS
jgi:hypothetical protein